MQKNSYPTKIDSTVHKTPKELKHNIIAGLLFYQQIQIAVFNLRKSIGSLTHSSGLFYTEFENLVRRFLTQNGYSKN